MFSADASNTQFKLAADLVNHTSRHLFLTGKAGTGKTTFLKYIKANTRKQAIVVAPTGVAAINAGGVTMHSFFQLPFGPFIPGTQQGFSTSAADVTNKHNLFKNIRFSAEKRDMLMELELLIIDEISMVRADMLDAMDTILRHFRKKLHQPFGGVQVLYIGDMYQLPPVVPNHEWDILQPYYESPFFFSAAVVAQAPPLYIELKKIYRQSDQLFIDVLNRVRSNQLNAADFTLLNNLYRPGFNPPSGSYITLSTHNRKADSINTTELEKLTGKVTVFTGTITGDFSEKALPTDMHLPLKEGAQVMFIKNDSGMDRRFFNGKLATIKKLNDEKIIVTANNDVQDEITIERETWRNIRYTYDKGTDSITEEELGSFTQYPLRLAWAVTIHKSQGLTFERAIIDAGESFAPGQVYVALSRCTSLEGMVLLSRLLPSSIATDPRVVAFAQKESRYETLREILAVEQQPYWAKELVKSFDHSKIISVMAQFRELVPGKKLPDTQSALALSDLLLNKARDQATVAEKFQVQLQQLIQQLVATGDISLLEERVTKGIGYFVKNAAEALLFPLQHHMASLQHAVRVRKYLAELADIEGFLIEQLRKMIGAAYGDIIFCKDPSQYQAYTSKFNMPGATARTAKDKPVKGSSQAETLELFKNGHSIKQIAAMRQLAESTIAGHLGAYVRTGEIDVLDLLTEERLNMILPVVIAEGGTTLQPVKEKLGDDFSYTDIRIVLNHWQRLQEATVNP